MSDRQTCVGQVTRVMTVCLTDCVCWLLIVFTQVSLRAVEYSGFLDVPATGETAPETKAVKSLKYSHVRTLMNKGTAELGCSSV